MPSLCMYSGSSVIPSIVDTIDLREKFEIHAYYTKGEKRCPGYEQADEKEGLHLEFCGQVASIRPSNPKAPRAASNCAAKHSGDLNKGNGI